MPAATEQIPAAKTEKEEELWIALKRHILRERQRKKEEQEAEVEEERLRKEREARERQDVMTLGETRDQIQIYSTKLEELQNEKKLLFLQLKKVLNEDDRKRQLHKESNDMFVINNLQQQQQQQQLGYAPQQQIFLPPRPPHQQIQLQKNPGQVGMPNTLLKRGRTPSPPPNQGYYKTNQQYSQGPKLEEGRRGGEVARAVLWNKPTQYSNAPGTLFFPTAQSNPPPDSRGQPIIFYPQTMNMPLRQQQTYHVDISAQQQQQQQQQHQHQQIKNDLIAKSNSAQQGNVYHINLDPPPQGPPGQSHKSIGPGGQQLHEKLSDRYHMDIKHDDRKDIRSSQQPPSKSHMPEGIVYTNSLRHIPMHSGMSMQPNQQQVNKPGGSITQGYANRQNIPNQSQQQPPPPQVQYQRRY